jgi:hypothetical protein
MTPQRRDHQRGTKERTMKNVTTELKGTKLIITVDTAKDFGPSASGKTTIVASTCGNITVGDVKVGLNVYKAR